MPAVCSQFLGIKGRLPGKVASFDCEPMGYDEEENLHFLTPLEVREGEKIMVAPQRLLEEAGWNPREKGFDRVTAISAPEGSPVHELVMNHRRLRKLAWYLDGTNHVIDEAMREYWDREDAYEGKEGKPTTPLITPERTKKLGEFVNGNVEVNSIILQRLCAVAPLGLCAEAEELLESLRCNLPAIKKLPIYFDGIPSKEQLFKKLGRLSQFSFDVYGLRAFLHPPGYTHGEPYTSKRDWGNYVAFAIDDRVVDEKTGENLVEKAREEMCETLLGKSLKLYREGMLENEAALVGRAHEFATWVVDTDTKKHLETGLAIKGLGSLSEGLPVERLMTVTSAAKATFGSLPKFYYEMFRLSQMLLLDATKLEMGDMTKIKFEDAWPDFARARNRFFPNLESL